MARPRATPTDDAAAPHTSATPFDRPVAHPDLDASSGQPRLTTRPTGAARWHGGWGGIRTHEALASLPVFKTGAFNRSATHPSTIFNALQ